MKSLNWTGIHDRAKTIGDGIAPYRNIGWVIGGVVWVIVMIWSYIANWFFPVFAFAFAGGWVVWCIGISIATFTRSRQNDRSAEITVATVSRSSPSSTHALEGSRAFFIGRWEAGEDTRSRVTFIISLHDSNIAERTPPCPQPGTAKWEHQDRKAVIRWPDGWRDELCVSAHGVVKVAFFNGKYSNSTTAVKLA